MFEKTFGYNIFMSIQYQSPYEYSFFFFFLPIDFYTTILTVFILFFIYFTFKFIYIFEWEREIGSSRVKSMYLNNTIVDQDEYENI